VPNFIVFKSLWTTRFIENTALLHAKISMMCAPVAAEEISKIIQTLPNNKSPGKDNIKAKF